jgi:hypothetical protein
MKDDMNPLHLERDMGDLTLNFRLEQSHFNGKELLLLLMVILSAVFSTAISAQVVETQAPNSKLANWVYQKPPNDIPLRVGVIPPEALEPPITSRVTKQFLVCNRVWLDQGGSYEQPFAVTYSSDNQVSEKVHFRGIFALDKYFYDTQNDWNRLEPNKAYQKGRDSIFNAGSEAVLLIDYNHPTGQGHRYFSLYVKRLNELPCAGLKRSQCKRFEASAELYELEKKAGFPSSYLRKVELGKVHIDSRCVGQQYLYHREPFLEKTSWFKRLLNTLRND